MKKKHFAEEQIALALHQADRKSTEEITRKLGISQATFIDGSRSMEAYWLQR